MGDMLETVGARLVLMGQREYVAGMAEAQSSMERLGAGAKTFSAASDEMTAATVKSQAAQKELSAAMSKAVAAQSEYNTALKASAQAEAEAAASGDAYAAGKRAEAAAATEAAAAKRDAALSDVAAAQKSSAAAASAAAEVEAAEARKAAAAEAGSKALKAAALGVGAVAAVVAVASVKMAADFQASTMRLVTSAGESAQNLDTVRQGILAMAGEVGYSAEALSAAMYKVESGGQHGAAGLEVLKAAAQGAKTENADLATVSDALTSVLQDYHLQASDSADVTSKLVAATSQGKMTFEELAGSLSSVLPIASANHVALNDILGDLASMTVHGMSAQQATQNLSDVIKHMAAPTMVQSKELATLGINSQQLAQDLGDKGLSGTLLEITKRIQDSMGPGSQKVIVDLHNALKGLPPEVQDLGQKLLDGGISLKDFSAAAKQLDPIAASQVKSFAALAGQTYQLGTQQVTGQQAMQSYTDALRRATGDATGLNVALMLTGENASTTTGDIAAIAGASKDAAGNVKGWDEIQSTLNVKLAQAGDGLGALAISIGTYLLPPLTVLVGWIASAAQWMSQHEAVAKILAIALGIVLVGALAALTVAFYGWMASIVAVEVAGAPLILIVLAIIAGIAILAGAVYLVIDNWGAISGFFVGLWDTVKSIFVSVWDWIVGVVEAAVGGIVAAWNGVVGFFVGVGQVFADIFHAIGVAATWLWENILSPVFNAISLAVRILIAIIVTVLVTPLVIAFNLLSGFVIFLWENAFRPAFEAIGAAAVWLYTNAIKPAWDGIQTAVAAVWNWLNTNVFQPIGVAVQAVGAAAVWLWNNAIVPAWQGIQNAVGAAWNWINANVIEPIKIAIQATGAVVMWLWNNAIVPAWQGIQNAVGAVWNWLKANVFDPIGVAINAIGTAFSNFWHGVIEPVWGGIQNAMGAAWNWIKTNVFDPIGVALTLLGAAFDNAQKFIGQVWDNVKAAIAGPIHWVVDVVYTHGIKAVWDKVADFVGLGHLADAPAFAGGGVIGGYAPGVDSVPAMLSPGEAVLVPELVQAIGPQAILAANAAYSGGRPGTLVGAFSGGGVVHAAGGATPAPPGNDSNPLGNALGAVGGFIGSAASAVGSAVSNIVGTIGDFMTDPVGKATSWLNDVFSNLAGGANTPVAKAVFEIPKKAVGGLIEKVKTWFASLIPTGGAYTGSPDLMGWIAAAEALTGVGADWTPGLVTLIMRESGGNPNAINLTDCVPLSTMILTRRGWMKHDEVQVGDETIGYNRETGRSEWTQVTRVVHYADAPLTRIGNSRWHATTTSNHRWLSKPRIAVRRIPVVETPDGCPLCDWPTGTRRRGATTAGGLRVHLAKRHGVKAEPGKSTYATEAKFVTTDDIASRDRLVLAAPADTSSALDVTVQEAAILGWIAGDGHVETIKHRPTMSIAQSKPAMVAKLRELLADVPHSLYVDEQLTRTGKVAVGPRHVWRIRHEYAQDLLRRAGHPKRDAVAQVLAMSTEQRTAWLDAMIDAEGHKAMRPGYTKPHVSISQTYGAILDAIALAVYLAGHRPNVRDNQVDNPAWSASASVFLNGPIVTGGFLRKEDAGRGDVWCVTTELGTWTAREDDHIFLTGNSNAAAGHPSQGLMQTIPSTFAAYHQAGTSGNITDPVANIAAGINYIRAVYGGIGNVQQANPNLPSKGYAGGGIVPARAMGGPVTAGQPYLVGERGPELFVPAQSGSISTADDTAAAQRGGGRGGQIALGTTVHVHPGAVIIHNAHDPQACYEATKQGIADAVARH